MPFNSYEFIVLFLPTVFLVYFWMSKRSSRIAKIWLLLSSFVFYGYNDIKSLPLLCFSCILNYLIGNKLSVQRNDWRKKIVLFIGVSLNVLFLVYFKYRIFIIENLKYFIDIKGQSNALFFPIGISFYTFQHISYLVDCYRKETKPIDLLNYCQLVSFFPHILSGPILRQNQIIPQFLSSKNNTKNYENIAKGIYVFSIGLFKKIIIADGLAKTVSLGFDNVSSIAFIDSWITSLSYTFQIYFDFSGYSDMAIGTALLFNIRLPINFDSPYLSLNIQDFWHRWHISLSQFWRDYLYIPLGGSKRGEAKTILNLIIVFLIAGIWHGASWMFVIWGVFHGISLSLHRLWRKKGIALPSWLAWFLTFNTINVLWIFFRSSKISDAFRILKGMSGYEGFFSDGQIAFLRSFHPADFLKTAIDLWWHFGSVIVLLVLFITVLKFKNSVELIDNFRIEWKTAFHAICLLAISFMSLNRINVFLYINF